MLTLDIAISTHRPEGIARVSRMVLPPIEGVNYVVSWQEHGNAPIPAELQRSDVAIYRFDQKGVSLNRNNAFAHCKSDVIVVSDDDLVLYADGLEKVRKYYEDNPEADFVTFRAEWGCQTKCYPECETRLALPLPKYYYVSNIEITIRRRTAGSLRFHPLFGLGAQKLQGGEDELLMLVAIKRGYDCRFVPIDICLHDHPSTGTKSAFTRGNLRAQGAVIALYWPKTAILRVPLKAWRVARAGRASLLKALVYIASGAIMGCAIYFRTRQYF